MTLKEGDYIKAAQYARHELDRNGRLITQRTQKYPERWRVAFFGDSGLWCDWITPSYASGILALYKELLRTSPHAPKGDK